MDPHQLSAVCRTRGIRLILQFGSTVSGRSHAASDVDLAVLLAQRPASLDEHVDLVADLQSLLPGQDVDVALINGADPLFLKKITEQCRLLYGGQPPPPGYHASFVKLGELGIVNPEFARRIARCAGLPNRLVHEYEEIDPRQVFESLQTARDDIVTYVRSVESYLDVLPGA